MTAGGPSGAITASEYARRCDPPMGKSAVSRLFAMGLPNYPGKDDHGRDCKFVVPDEADRWRAAFTTPRLDGRTSLVRGAPDLRPRPIETAAAPARPPPSPPSGGGAGAAQPAPPGSPAGGAGAGPQAIAVRIQEAKATKAEEEALTATRRRETLDGALLSRSAAIHAHEAFVGLMGSTLERMPADQATAVAGDLGVTKHAAYLALRRIAESVRADLERSARREALRLGLETDEGS